MKNFTMIPNEIFQDTRLKAFQFKVLAGLYRFRNVKTELAYPKRETLAQMLGCDPRSISRTTKELGELGWLTKIGNGGRSRATLYRMHVPKTLTSENPDQPDTVSKDSDQTVTQNENVDSRVTGFTEKGSGLVRGIEQTIYNKQYGTTPVGVPQGALAPQGAPVDGCGADNIKEEKEKWDLFEEEDTESSENQGTWSCKEGQPCDLSSIESKKVSPYPFEYYYITTIYPPAGMQNPESGYVAFKKHWEGRFEEHQIFYVVASYRQYAYENDIEPMPLEQFLSDPQKAFSYVGKQK